MASGTERSGVNATAEQAAAVPVTQKREFWVLMGYAAVLGCSERSLAWCSSE